jgi:DNA-binding MarR family transcriptional regulator
VDALTSDELAVCAEMLATCACERLRSAARRVTQTYEAAIGPGGLRATQLPILVALGSVGEMALTALADAIGVDRTTLTRNLAVLEQRGLVTAATDDQDARVRLISITPAGRAALSDGLRRWQQVHAGVEQRFGRERLAALHAELAALSAAVQA